MNSVIPAFQNSVLSGTEFRVLFRGILLPRYYGHEISCSAEFRITEFQGHGIPCHGILRNGIPPDFYGIPWQIATKFRGKLQRNSVPQNFAEDLTHDCLKIFQYEMKFNVGSTLNFLQCCVMLKNRERFEYIRILQFFLIFLFKNKSF